MRLVSPHIRYKEEIVKYREEFTASGEQMHGGVGLHQSESIEHWLRMVKDHLRESTVHPGRVPNSVFLALDEHDHLVGMINIRHRLNEYYEKYGGHIGYGVRPSERKKGFATQMLALALKEAVNLGLDKVLITCSTTNIGSAKTILNNGGIFENEVFDPHDRTMTQRYWITLK